MVVSLGRRDVCCTGTRRPGSLGPEQAADASGRRRRHRQGARRAGPAGLRRRASASGVHGQDESAGQRTGTSRRQLHAAARVGGPDAGAEAGKDRRVRGADRRRRTLQPLVVQLSSGRPHPRQRDAIGAAHHRQGRTEGRRTSPGLPIDFTKRAQQLLDIGSRQGLRAQPRPSTFSTACRRRRPATSAAREEDFPIHYPADRDGRARPAVGRRRRA